MSVRTDTREWDKRLDHVLNAMGAKGMRKLGTEAKARLKRDSVAAVHAGHSPSGRPWAQRKVPRPWAPLRNTGQLVGSIDPSFFTIGKTGVLVKGSVKAGNRADGKAHGLVAGVQQFGHPKMKARPFVGFSSESFKKLAASADRFIGSD